MSGSLHKTLPITADEAKPKTMTEAHETLDFSFLQSFLDTKEELQAAADKFTDSANNALSNLKKAHANNNKHTEWVEAAHQFKGCAAMIGAQKLSHICQHAQNLQPHQSNDYESYIENIENALHETQTALQENIAKIS